MSKAEYYVDVYVINNGTTQFYIEGTTFNQIKDDPGSEIVIVKKDPQQKPGASNETTATKTKDTPPKDTFVYNGFTFMNRYEPLSDLTLSKEVKGDYGDKMLPFDFSLTLTNSDASGQTFTAYIPGTSPVQTIDFAFASGATTATNTFKLKHGQTLVFDGTNGSTKLPVGTTYSYTETGVMHYIPGAVTVCKPGGEASDIEVTTPDGDEGKNYTVAYKAEDPSKNLAAIVGTGTGNNSALTNTYREVTPTGFLIDNMPYILLIGIPIVAAIVWLVIRRRRANN